MVEQSFIKSQTPTGAWRAPISNVYAFAEQSFIAELAHKAGQDHRNFLLNAIGDKGWIKEGDIASLNTARARATIEAVTKAAGWGRELPEGHGLGLAFFLSYSGHITEVAEVIVDGKKKTCTTSRLRPMSVKWSTSRDSRTSCKGQSWMA